MKTNKITLMVMGLAVACLLASCKKDNDNSNDNNTPADGKGFIGYTEWNGGNRTHGVPNGNIIAVNWTEVDEILVANQSGDTLTYTLSEGKDSTVGKFESERQTDEFLEPNYAAIYPAKNAEGVKNNITVTADGITATFNLPATQNYLENSFAEKSMPMAAYSENQIFQFKNVLGGICFPLVGAIPVTKIVVTSANADEALWGTCTTVINADGGDPTSTVSNTATSGKNTITLNCGEEGVQLNLNTPTDFYIMVPAGSLGDGFTMTAYNGTNIIYENSISWTEANPNFISRNVVRKVDRNLEVIIDKSFSISQNKRVYFSPGNLQYQASTNTWRFAEHQYDCVGDNDNNNTMSTTSSNWVDLFGWGTWTGNRPASSILSTSTYITGYYYSSEDFAGELDGHNDWYTLTIEEWIYILVTRADANEKNSFAKVAGINGLILLPDTWYGPALNPSHEFYSSNTISLDEWEVWEYYGAVFLPAGGVRSGTIMTPFNDNGYVDNTMGAYWSSSPRYDNKHNRMVLFESNDATYHTFNYSGGYASPIGCCVRLVRNVKTTGGFSNQPFGVNP